MNKLERFDFAWNTFAFNPREFQNRTTELRSLGMSLAPKARAERWRAGTHCSQNPFLPKANYGRNCIRVSSDW
jgi:hypothetical protein